ncbi:MAG: hypothetical protein IJ537_09520 [Bacteroidaceae bacterium]|nr:hypothetical protein [Bacteroidaceae bacterium]
MKTNLFLTVLLLLAGLTSAHAEVVQIGSGSGTNASLPTNVYYRYSISQQIYTAEELGAAGTIKSIAFYNNGTFSSSRNLYIYFVATDLDGLYSQADWIEFSSADEVFGEFVDFMPKEWTTITLQNPFQYDGKKNLAVIVTDDTGSCEREEVPFLTFESDRAALFIHNDNNPYNSRSLSDYQAARANAKNQIKLDIDRPKYIDRIEITGFTEPVFPGVTIKLYSNAFFMADIGFLGNYYSLSQYDVATDFPPDEGVYYLEGGGPILKKFSDDTELRAFSCFFEVFSFSVYADESKAGFGVLFPGERLSDLVTGIDSPATQPEEGPIYNLAGQRLQKMQRGVNIIGSRKILVK